MNARSIVNKIDELRAETFRIKPDLIAVTESWTHDNITNAFLNIDGYQFKMRQDKGGRGGGILLYASKSTISNSIIPSSNIFKVNQCIFCDIQSSTGDLVTLITVYRSPCSCNVNYVENAKELNKLVTSLKTNSILSGDFNFSGLDWESFNTTDKQSEDFLEQGFL